MGGCRREDGRKSGIKKNEIEDNFQCEEGRGDLKKEVKIVNMFRKRRRIFEENINSEKFGGSKEIFEECSRRKEKQN